MKRIIVTLLLVLWLAPNAKAFTVKEEVQVVPPPQSYVEPSPSPTIGEVKSTVNRLLVSSRKKIEATVEKRDSATARSIEKLNASINQQSSGIALKVDESVKTLNDRLIGKGGEFEKMIGQIWSASKEADRSTTHWVGWMTFWIILTIILVVGIATLSIRRHLGRVEKGMTGVVEKGLSKKVKKIVEGIDIKADATLAAIEALPAKTAEHVHAFFDRKPLEVSVAGHNIIFNQDDDVLDRRAYQILLVEDGVDPATTPATYELQEVSDRNKAVDSLKRTMRENFNGKLAAKSDSASKLTLELIKYYEGTKKLVIS